MRIVNKRLLVRFVRKNHGNAKLLKAITQLIKDIEENEWSTDEELKRSRQDADKVHPKGYYIFDLANHRLMIMIEFTDSNATILWCGDHDEYELTFKNNKNTIKKWLRNRDWI